MASCFVTLTQKIGQQPEKCLTSLYAPQLAKIYVFLLKLDNVGLPESCVWPHAFKDLLEMAQSATTEASGKLLFKFFLKTLLTFDEEVVERAEQKAILELEIATRLKDSFREGPVHIIVPALQGALNNYQNID